MKYKFKQGDQVRIVGTKKQLSEIGISGSMDRFKGVQTVYAQDGPWTGNRKYNNKPSYSLTIGYTWPEKLLKSVKGAKPKVFSLSRVIVYLKESSQKGNFQEESFYTAKQAIEFLKQYDK